MASLPSIKRLAVCVDGTWYDPDGQEGHGNGNNSNVFRVYAAIKRGKFTDTDGRQVEQVAHYFPGIGVGKKPLNKFNDGITGEGCKQQIQEVFKYCCDNLRSPKDELWLYGFSRGAYVVRAVAGLLHHVEAMSSSNKRDFEKAYQEALGLLPLVRNPLCAKANSGKLYQYFEEMTREKPVIQFLGLFDTVKATNDNALHDLSFLGSIRHARHAVAMNENRKTFAPTLYDPIPNPATLNGRSMIEAWFVGGHADIGGGARHDGLSLYPLQWMLVESKRFGLILEHNPGGRSKQLIQDPIKLAFPSELLTQSVASTGIFEQQPPSLWRFWYSNGIEVEMHDLRVSHNHGNLQEALSPDSKDGWSVRNIWRKPKTKDILQDNSSDIRTEEPRPLHIVRINKGAISLNVPRRPFRSGQTGELLGYCDQAACGTIIHPSVYFLADTYPRLGIEDALKDYAKDIQAFRNSKLQGKERDPWLLERHFRTGDVNEVKAFRILVCGKAGVGKSTLINHVFGINLTKVSHQKHGIHNIDQGFESDSHPGIIIHDSRGFQGGSDEEIDLLKKIHQEALVDERRTPRRNMLCIETGSTRMIHKAEEHLFQALEEHAANTPIVIVRTMKDKFIDEHQAKARRMMKRTENSHHRSSTAIDEAAQLQAEQELSERQKDDFKELEERGLRKDFAPFAYVSQDDPESIKLLLQKTLDLVLDEGAQINLSANQVLDVEPKIKRAITESVRLLRYAGWTSTVGAPAVFVSTVSTPTISWLLCNKVIRCFGFSNVKSGDVDKIMSKVVWWNLMKYMAQHVSQTLVVWGGVVTLTLFTIVGGIPLAVGALLLEIIPAARMIVKCACDLIIILDRAFCLGGRTVTSKQIMQASVGYTSRVAHGTGKAATSRRAKVHHEIDELLPILTLKFYKALQIAKVQAGIEDIITRNRFIPDDSKRVESALLLQPVSSHSSLSDEVEELAAWDQIASSCAVTK